MWLKMFLNWLTGKKVKEQYDADTPEEVLRPPVKKGSLGDIRDFCDEIRKDLWIQKKTNDRLYVEMGNLKDKIERFLNK